MTQCAKGKIAGSSVKQLHMKSEQNSRSSAKGEARYLPVHVHAMAQRLIEEYLALAGHGQDAAGPLFRPVMNNRTDELQKPLDGSTVLKTSSVNTRGKPASTRRLRVSVCTRCMPRPPPMLSTTRRISPRSKSGWATQMFPPRACMTGAKRGPEDSPTFRIRY
jgi:integrase/recombinase XerD